MDSRLQVGQPVCALTNGGGYAEYVAVPQGHVLPVPKKYSMIEAAAFPETVFTVWHNVFQPDILPHGASILVHGGTSGIGSTALQLGSALGYRMYTTSGSTEKCQAAMKFGATAAFNYNTEDWAVKMRDAGGAFFVLDMVGGPYFQRNLEVLQTGGRYGTRTRIKAGACVISFFCNADLPSSRSWEVPRQRLTSCALCSSD